MEKEECEAALEEKESETQSRGGWNGAAPLPLPLRASCWRHLESLQGTSVCPWAGPCQPQGTSGPACGAESLTPGLSGESRDQTGPLSAFLGSSDFSACPQNKRTTDKTLWSGAEDLL